MEFDCTPRNYTRCTCNECHRKPTIFRQIALADLDDDDKLKLTKDEIDALISNEGIKCSVDPRVQSLNLVSESGLYDLATL